MDPAERQRGNEETVFMAVFTLCAGLAAVTVLPALFAG